MHAFFISLGRLAPVAVGVALLTAASTASASPTFPSEVQTHLGLSSTPTCLLCHTSLSGGIGTATHPFGATVRAHGAVAENTGSLDTALDQMAADGSDSDGDCVGDVVELKAGTDPDNGGDNPGKCGDGGSSSGGDGGSSGNVTQPAAPLEPQYGCAAAPARSSGSGPAPFALAAAFVAWAWLRGARRRSSKSSC